LPCRCGNNQCTMRSWYQGQTSGPKTGMEAWCPKKTSGPTMDHETLGDSKVRWLFRRLVKQSRTLWWRWPDWDVWSAQNVWLYDLYESIYWFNESCGLRMQHGVYLFSQPAVFFFGRCCRAVSIEQKSSDCTPNYTDHIWSVLHFQESWSHLTSSYFGAQHWPDVDYVH